MNQRAYRRYNITNSENPTVDDSPFIFVDKGCCSFVSKVLNIEEARGYYYQFWKRRKNGK